MTPEQTQALEIARALTSVGIPVFVAQPDPDSTTGYRLPSGWQSTPPDPRVVDTWQPGMALAMVMGHGLDLVDVDPRSGGDPSSLNGRTPTSYGAALTPSGGLHSFIRSLGVRSRDNVLPGIDVKAGDAQGRGRGFAFIAPTERASKVTGELTAYRWASVPDLTRLVAVLSGQAADESGAALAGLIAELRGASHRSEHEETAPYDGPPFAELPIELQKVVMQWVAAAVEGIQAELKASADWDEGQTDDHGRGWEKLQADAALRLGRLARATWNDLGLTDAEAAFCEAAPVDGSWGSEDVELKWAQQHGRLDPAPWPGLRSSAERDAEAWAALGLTPPEPVGPVAAPAGGARGAGNGSGGQEAAAGAPDPAQPPPSAEAIAARYFGTGGIQAATLAGDTLSLGPLRVGRDDIMWSYGGGVWTPDKHAVRDRLARLLGQRFRTSFIGTVEAVVRAYVPTITCEPIPDLVNFANGLLDWRAGELGPHSPDVPTTVQLAVDYDPDAACPAFDEFIDQVVPEDVIPTVWELIGYLMYSGNPLHKAVMLTGTGRNGKGTFLRVVEAMLGSRNITNVSLHDLVNTRFSTASLFGKLANIAGDIDAGYLENTATFKGITGGDTISAEHKGRDRFDFKPWAVPMFSANKIPASADTTIGYLSRWLVVPFPSDFTGREDRHLDARLHAPAELRGIAARGIAALPALLARGDFELTASGELAREDFIRRVDQVRTWLADCCDIHPEHPFVARVELYQAYKTWAFRDGHKPVRATEFYERLEQAGADPAKMRGTRGFKRVQIIDDGTGPYRLTAVPQLPPTPAPHSPTAASEGLGAGEEGVCAPSSQNGKTAGQPQSFHNEGAEGAQTPQPPDARVRTRGGCEKPAPSAPKPKSTSKRGSSAASEKRARAAAERRAAAIAEAGGPLVPLPALVMRDGSTTAVNLEDVHALLDSITSGPCSELTVDVEHTGYPVGHQHYALRTVQLGNEHFALVLDPNDPDQAEVIGRHLAAARILHAHSATADLVPLAYAGLLDDLEEAWARMHDTVIPAKLADPASTGSDPSLKKLATAVLGDDALSESAEDAKDALFKAGKWLKKTEVTTPVERSGWAQVDSTCTTMVRYAAADVLDDAALATRLPTVPPRVLDRERLAQRMTARVAYHGLRLDAEHVSQLRGQQQAALADASARLVGFGIENPGSDQQVAAAVERQGLELPRTRTGRPSVASGVLDPYRGAEGPLGELIRARLAYQEAENRLGLFLDGYHLAVTNGDGRVRPTVYTMEAKTGRMSCVRPNLQQVPREGGYRACITADEGEVLISADFSGVELRVAAALSQDPNLMAIVADPDRDIHREVAQIVWGPDAGKAERYMAKRKVFGRLYGSGINGLVTSDPPVSEATARAIVDALDQMTPGLAAWSRMVADGIESGRTQFQTYSGRIVHMPRDRGYAGPNYCIQGTARELLIDALERWSRTRWGDAVLLPVHDELVVKVPAEDATEATTTLVECMASELAGVRIAAEPSQPSFAWADSV